MSTFPTASRSAFLEWCQAHALPFTTHATAIGLTSGQATAFSQNAVSLAAAMLAQEQAKQAQKVATQTVEAALAAMKEDAGEAVRLIRAFAESQAAPLAVYNLAQISPPAAASPAPPPGQPENLSVQLEPGRGFLTLAWKCVNPEGTSGTTYIVRRKLPGEAAFEFLGVSGKKRFVDQTLPAGIPSAQYIVQGQRADVPGPFSPIFVVHFGSSTDGARRVQGGYAGTPGGYAPAAVWNAEIPAPGAMAGGNGHGQRAFARH